MNTSAQQNINLALAIRRGHWLLYDAEAYLPIVEDFLLHSHLSVDSIDFTPMAYASFGESYKIGPDFPKAKKSVAVIPIHGALTKYDSCGTIGAVTIADYLMQIATDKHFVGCVLDIDSPGGACNAIPVLLEAISKIKEAGKPIVAHADLCASAAYWIASQCDSIFADNSLSHFGSIGVMTQILDDSNRASGVKVISIYAKESSAKNKPYREALKGNIEPMQEEMSPIVRQFHEAVKAGRRTLDLNTKDILAGEMFYTSEALKAGLIDNIHTLPETIQNVFDRTDI